MRIIAQFTDKRRIKNVVYLHWGLLSCCLLAHPSYIPKAVLPYYGVSSLQISSHNGRVRKQNRQVRRSTLQSPQRMMPNHKNVYYLNPIQHRHIYNTYSVLNRLVGALSISNVTTSVSPCTMQSLNVMPYMQRIE